MSLLSAPGSVLIKTYNTYMYEVTSLGVVVHPENFKHENFQIYGNLW